MNILGIETSCDETAAAVVCAGSVLSNIVRSQIELHAPYGGVVPEIASRNHVTSLPEVISAALEKSALDWPDLDGVAVTYGPGLATSLLVGLSAGKALSLRLDKELICVNHLEAHLHSPFLELPAGSFSERCPFLSLIVSGGHTILLLVEELGRYRVLGATLDDAAGEAFDKGAQLLGLGYPGGPAIERAAAAGNRALIKFPRGRIKPTAPTGGLAHDLCFSFSGLKTSLLYRVKSLSRDQLDEQLPDLAAGYQESIIASLIERCALALKREKLDRLAVSGGVSLNSRLRERLVELTTSAGIELMLAKPEYCADNAAMIAGVAAAGGGVRGAAAWALDVSPNLQLGCSLKALAR